MRGISFLWLLFNTKIGNIILAIIICYLVVTLMGWLLIPIILTIIALFLLADGYERIKFNKLHLKEAEIKREKVLLQNQNKKKAFLQRLKDYPQVVGDVALDDSKKKYDLYWLCVGKGGIGNDVFENKYFKIAFGIAKDYNGLIVSITNNSDKVIFVDWRSFVINSSSVHIDGVIYEKYPDDNYLPPCETATRLLQSHELLGGEKKCDLFDPKEMSRNDKIYQVIFKIKDGDGEVRIFQFKLRTQHKCYKFEDNNIDEISMLRKAIEYAKNLLKLGYLLIVIALIFLIGIICYKNRFKFNNRETPYIEHIKYEKKIEKKADVKDSPSYSPISPSIKSTNHSENMQGFDPASEDDMDDNGMTRYMEANDEEGWD